MLKRCRSGLVPGLVGLLAGWASALFLPLHGPAPAQQAMPTFKPEAPANRNLDAGLYMQTSAEYRACCYQAYNLAAARLEALVKEKQGEPKRPLAVVLDL